MKSFSLATLALFAAWFLFALGPAQAADGGWSAERTKQYFEDMNDLHPMRAGTGLSTNYALNNVMVLTTLSTFRTFVLFHEK